MGFRFRKSLSLGRGVRVNISKRGFSSVSVGRPGATLNIGRRGIRETVGLPGTGLSYTTGSKGNPLAAIIGLVVVAIGALFALIASALRGNRLSQVVLCALVALGLFGYLRTPTSTDATGAPMAVADANPPPVVPVSVSTAGGVGQPAPLPVVSAEPIALQPTASTTAEDTMLTTTGANLRGEASPHAPILRQLGAGASVEVIGGDGHWVKVRVADGGNVGWINRSLLRKP